MKAYKFPEYDTPIKIGKSVAVIGGGNTAMDGVRTSKRLGAEHSYLIYRRSRTEMPARLEEVHHAEEEGIEFKMLTNPTRIIGDENGRVSGIECQKMELGEPDDSGRRKPVFRTSQNSSSKYRPLLRRSSQSPNPIIQSTTPGLKTGRKGVVVADELQRTSREGIFAGGDLSRGGATVILAMRDGKITAGIFTSPCNKKHTNFWFLSNLKKGHENYHVLFSYLPINIIQSPNLL